MTVAGSKQFLRRTNPGRDAPWSAVVSCRGSFALGVDYDWDHIEANGTGSVHVYE
ncbi:hypothetical protein [Halosimplex marinum]|uniref:hypothetical protein n=1 Tax=Halosimplex marinum TaxID=3396620 RepID=UPI003F54D0C4